VIHCGSGRQLAFFERVTGQHVAGEIRSKPVLFFGISVYFSVFYFIVSSTYVVNKYYNVKLDGQNG